MIQHVRLADILDVQNGFAFKSEFFCDVERGIPLIRIRDISVGYTEINYIGSYREDFIVNRGDFIIGMDGDFRCFRWSGAAGLLNQRVCRLRNFAKNVEPEYIFHWIGKKLREIHSTTAFVTVKHISSKQILNLSIALPPLAEQRRVVDILNHAASVRRLRDEARAKLREITPSLFAEMFGDPMTNSKGWPVSPLAQVIAGLEGEMCIRDSPIGELANRIAQVMNRRELPGDGGKHLQPGDVGPSPMPAAGVQQPVQWLAFDVAEDQEGNDFASVALPDAHVMVGWHGGCRVEALENGGDVTE